MRPSRPVTFQPSRRLQIGHALFILSLIVIPFLSREMPSNIDQMALSVFLFLLYLAYRLIATLLFARHFSRGHLALVSDDFDGAIAHFEKAAAFFERHEWIDRFRWITILSVSAPSLRELSLINLGFCHAMAGNKEQSKRSYQHALETYPQSLLAKEALRMIETFETPNDA